MKRNIRTSLGWLGREIRGHFFAGILIIVPVGLTMWILVWIFASIDDFLQGIAIEPIFGHEITGVGFAITIVIIYIAGFIASNVIGKKLIRYGESLLGKVPIARYLYTGIRQIMNSFSEPGRTGFMQVVLVEFPRKDIRTIGFVTNEISDESGEKLINVFIPTAPNPTSGFLQIARESDIIRTTISVEAALKMVVSGGRISPQEVADALAIIDQGLPVFDQASTQREKPIKEEKTRGKRGGL